MLHDKTGCPPTFDKISQESIEEVTSKALSVNTLEYLSHLRKEAELSATRRGKSIQSQTNPSRTTIWRAEMDLNVRTGVGDDRRPDCLKSAPSPGNGGLVAYFIKYFLLIFADGTFGPLVFVVANDSKEKHAVDIDPVQGLGISTDVQSSGYVVFCKTSCCYSKFFRWLIYMYYLHYKIIFTCIQERKIVFNFDPATLTWFQLEGEPVQIEIYNDPEMIQKLQGQNIVIDKPSTSTSEIIQPYDKENCFLGPKAALKYIHDLDVTFKERMVERKAVVCDAHQEKHGYYLRTIKSSSNTASSSSNGFTKQLAFSYDH